MAITVTSNSTTQAAEAAPKEAEATPKAEPKEETKSAAPANVQERETVGNSDPQIESEDEGEDPESDEPSEQEALKAKDEKKEKQLDIAKIVQKRLKRTNRQLSEKDQEIAFLRGELERRSRAAEPAATKVTTQSESGDEPKEEDFDSHKDYVKALSKWTYEQEKIKDESKNKEVQAKTEFGNRVESFKESSKKYGLENEGFDELMTEAKDYKFSPGFTECLLDSEVGPKVLHHLLKDQKDLDRINSLDPISTAREFGKLEARLTESPSKPKQTTSAPPPPTPVSGKSDKATKKTIYDSNLSFKEYEKLRLAEIASTNSF